MDELWDERWEDVIMKLEKPGCHFCVSTLQMANKGSEYIMAILTLFVIEVFNSILERR